MKEKQVLIQHLMNSYHLSQRYADGPCPAAHIQHRAVLIQLGPFPHSRVEHLCSSCIHLPDSTDTQHQTTAEENKKACKVLKVFYLEEGMRRYSELEAQEFLVDAALSSHQLTGQVLQVRGRPWKSKTII